MSYAMLYCFTLIHWYSYQLVFFLYILLNPIKAALINNNQILIPNVILI